MYHTHTLTHTMTHRRSHTDSLSLSLSLSLTHTHTHTHTIFLLQYVISLHEDFLDRAKFSCMVYYSSCALSPVEWYGSSDSEASSFLPFSFPPPPPSFIHVWTHSLPPSLNPLLLHPLTPSLLTLSPPLPPLSSLVLFSLFQSSPGLSDKVFRTVVSSATVQAEPPKMMSVFVENQMASLLELE